MNQFCLSEYEKAFLCRIIENNMIWKEYLIEQIENSIIVSRDNTGCGCYIDFQVNLERTNLNKYENIPIFLKETSLHRISQMQRLSCYILQSL